jgi:hypothetical protein
MLPSYFHPLLQLLAINHYIRKAWETKMSQETRMSSCHATPIYRSTSRNERVAEHPLYEKGSNH